MKTQGVILFLLACLVVSPCWAGQVTLLSGQKDYYFLSGEEAALPLTLNNTYDHDIKGTLRFITLAEQPGGNATRALQERTFTLFTGERSYLLPAGRSGEPAVLHCDIVFLYNENGGRKAALEDIVVHFVKSPEEIVVNQSPQESTDAPDTAAESEGTLSVSGSSPPSSDPLRRLQNNQMQPDLQSLQQQIRQEDAASLLLRKEFLSLLMQDPTISAINRSLTTNGFRLVDPGVSPLTNVSGNFSLAYDKSGQAGVVHGSADEGVLLFADESGGAAIPIPDLLNANERFRSAESDLVQGGFARTTSWMYYTPGEVVVNLTYGDAKNRTLHLDAVIVNGTVTAIERGSFSEPLPLLLTVLSIGLIALLFGGIIFLGRRVRPSPLPVAEKPVPEERRNGYRETAETMRAETEEMAAGGCYPAAYARAGQALRLVLSHRMSDGRELTNEEAVRLLSGETGNEQITTTLERFSMVAFAKDTPDPAEFAGMLKCSRDLLGSREREKPRSK
jgi:hypothetical protein